MTTAMMAALRLVTLGLTALSYQTQMVCKQLSYENKNQADYGPLRVPSVRGIATDVQGVAVPGVCVGIFTEQDHKLIAVTETDDRGRFEFKDTLKGNYRLVAKYEGFSPANAKLRIEPSSKHKKPLALHMKFQGIDTASFVGLK
jgi:hypothetical protein